MLLLVLFMASLPFPTMPPFNQQLLLLPSKQFSSLSLSSLPPSSSSIYNMIQLVSHQIKGHVCNQSVENVFLLLSFFFLFTFPPYVVTFMATQWPCFLLCDLDKLCTWTFEPKHRNVSEWDAYKQRMLRMELADMQRLSLQVSRLKPAMHTISVHVSTTGYCTSDLHYVQSQGSITVQGQARVFWLKMHFHSQ